MITGDLLLMVVLKSCLHYKPWPSLGLALVWPWSGQGKCGAFTPLHDFFVTGSLWPRILLLILCIFMCCDVARRLAANLSLWAHVAMKIRPRPQA